jgi:parallel beta-helix repeat protein
VWELNSDLVVQGGARLNLSGDVKELRLQSLPSGLTTDVSALIAQYGTIDITGVKVTSWNGTGPDTDLTVPTGGTRGRAFVRAVSFMEGSTPRPSTMNIVDSDLGFLGYNAAESYGVSYKARGCGATTSTICDVLDVLGKQTGSTFHDNYIGTYTWGAKNMVFDHNVYTHNKSYGLDPHDDSDYLTITNNTFSENGNHGLICSQRCDHLVIRGNTSRHNTSASAETHGIMLHRGVTDAVVENNTVENNSTGGGIVVFDSVGNSIKNNTVTGNKYGLRFSVGTKDLAVSGNTVKGSLQYAVYLHLQGQRRAQLHGDQRAPDGHHVHRQHLRRRRRGAVQDPGTRTSSPCHEPAGDRRARGARCGLLGARPDRLQPDRVAPGRQPGQHPLHRHPPQHLGLGEQLVGGHRQLTGAVDGAHPRPAHRHPAPAQAHRPGPVPVAGRGTFGVVTALAPAHCGHVGFHHRGQHLQPGAHGESQQPFLHFAGQLGQRHAHPLRHSSRAHVDVGLLVVLPHGGRRVDQAGQSGEGPDVRARR